jgi:hypothetical protein
MKYLKLFESTIKHIDPIAIEHPLRNFSRKLEDIIISLKKLDDFESTVRRYFHDDGFINIIYKINGGKLLSATMRLELTQVELTIINYITWFDKKYMINSKDFSDLVDINLKKYKIYKEIYDLPSHINSVNYYKFTIGEINNILNEIENYYNLIHAKKYNI